MESFRALVQKNVLNQKRVWSTRDELNLAIVTWMEHAYNHRRRQRGLGRLTPVECDLAFAATQAARCSKPLTYPKVPFHFDS